MASGLYSSSNTTMNMKRTFASLFFVSVLCSCKTNDTSLAYESVDVNFTNNESQIALSGTLTLPKSVSRCPGLILVTGSGPQNRNEELFGHKPFERIADYFSSRGMAVLRYDDRGTGESEGDFAKADTDDFMSDALAAFDFLRTYPGVDSFKTGIAGHSEGGLIAAMAASKRSDVAFVVMLAGPALKGEEISILQSIKILRNMKMSENKIREIESLNRRIYALAKEETDTTILKSKIREIMFAAGVYGARFDAIFKSVANRWFKRYLTLDPACFLAKTDCPVLALFGEKDFQVPADENIAAIDEIIENSGKKNIAIKSVPGVNHLFQNAKTGMIDEYDNADESPMTDETLQTIYDWLIDARIVAIDRR